MFSETTVVLYRDGALLVLEAAEESVVTAVTGPCCPVVRCRFEGAHRPHAYNDGRCPGRCCPERVSN